MLTVAILALLLAVSQQASRNTSPSRELWLAADSARDSEDSVPEDGDPGSSDPDSGYPEHSDWDIMDSRDNDSEDTVRDDDSGTGDDAGTGTVLNTRQPLALIYRNDPLGDSEDAKDLGAMLRKSRFAFRIQYVGPKYTPLTADLLARAALFAQPGGEVDTETAKQDFAHEIPLVQPWVAKGGRFLGICAGGFVAGKEGYGVFPGEVGSYVGSPNSLVKDDRDQAIQINWQGRQRTVDFQDGNYFKIPPGTPGVTVLGTYNNGLVAAAVATHGKGKAAFAGPHFESASDDAGTPTPAMDLSFQLVDVLMSGSSNAR